MDELRTMGTLGGGNRQDGNYFLTVHSGSRSFGTKVCGYQQEKIDSNRKFDWLRIKKKWSESRTSAKYLQTEEMLEYLIDIVIGQHFTSLNRTMMIRSVIEQLEGFILRKGAISANLNETCKVSLNMRDGILFV